MLLYNLTGDRNKSKYSGLSWFDLTHLYFIRLENGRASFSSNDEQTQCGESGPKQLLQLTPEHQESSSDFPDENVIISTTSQTSWQGVMALNPESTTCLVMDCPSRLKGNSSLNVLLCQSLDFMFTRRYLKLFSVQTRASSKSSFGRLLLDLGQNVSRVF